MNVSIIGSTGSIGQQALDVISSHPDLFRVVGLSAGGNLDVLARQVREHRPRTIAVKSGLGGAIKALVSPGVKVLEGEDGLDALASLDEADLVLIAIVGAQAILPVTSGIKARKTIALANKECLVAAGHIIMEMAEKMGVQIIPVDSEHSAIFQCLQGQDREGLQRITLTASGGAFRDRPAEDLAGISPEEALHHPTWRMGKKVTVDSATLMNKGFEVIEARWLFGLPPGGIRVLIHPQSIVHSLVEFKDGSTLAHLGPPDMRIPIRYSLGHPRRLQGSDPIDLAALGRLDFREPDMERYPCLARAYQALEAGGTLPAVMNAADEVAVEGFLGGKCGFLDIERIITEVMEKHTIVDNPSLEDIMKADAWARREAMHVAGILDGDGC